MIVPTAAKQMFKKPDTLMRDMLKRKPLMLNSMNMKENCWKNLNGVFMMDLFCDTK